MLINNTSRIGQSAMAIAVCLPIAVGWVLLPHPIIGIALGLVPLLVIFVLKQPFLMVLLFVLFSFFRLHEVFPQLYLLRIPLLLSLASLAALIWHVGLTRKVSVYWSPELTRASLFFVLVILSIILASNRPIAITYFSGIYWKIVVMTFAIAWLAQAEKDFSLSLKLITLSGLSVGLVALYNKANSISLVEGTRVTIGRDLGSVLGDPNDLSLVLLFPLSFSISLMLSTDIDRRDRLLGLVTAVVLILAVIATQSRGGLLGIVAVIAAFAWRRVKSKTLLISCGSSLLLVLYAIAGISGRESGGAHEQGIDESAMGRLHAWDAAIDMALDNPLSGVGIDNFYYNYFFYSEFWDGMNHAVHSTWFGVLGETGFLGLLIFLSMLFAVVRCAINTLAKINSEPHRYPPIIATIAEGILSGIIGFCVAGTFLTQGFTWPLYILLAFTVALSHFVSNFKGAA
jgi:probable O-glycosylation ligase (exosortase A-associated)